MSYGGLRYTRASPDGGIPRSTWGWRAGRIWVGCSGCGVPRELPLTHAISSHGQVEPLAVCDRRGCGVEVRLTLGGWTDDDTALWKQLVTGGLDAA